tara:strand:- start:2893 stop:3042 length:150 start_codon:yes stop_codon:yes gene_type:complete
MFTTKIIHETEDQCFDVVISDESQSISIEFKELEKAQDFAKRAIELFNF